MKASENELLTRVGPGTPGGEMFRRYWHPVGLSADLGSKPKLVRILGEDLVLFRKRDGVCGLVDAICPHRGANLVAGYVEGEGIRCAYHGWLFDVKGRCLEQPAEPASSRLKDRVTQKSYPVEELGGLIFAYLGPDPRPLLPQFDVLVSQDGQRRPGFARHVPANWLQVVDNHQDPSHTTYLHIQMQPWEERPQCHYVETALGSMSIQVRSGPQPNTKYVRETHFIAPNGLKVCIPDAENEDFSSPSTRRLVWVVPMDDENSIEWELLFAPNKRDGTPSRFKYDPDPKLYRMDVPKPYQEYINPGVPCVPEYDSDGAVGATVVLRQDTLIQSSQGRIQPRENERLGVSDQGVILLRKIVKDCIDAVASGKDPKGLIRDPEDNECVVVEATEEVIPNDEFDRMIKVGSLYAARAAT